MRQVFGNFNAYPPQSMLRGRPALTLLLAAAIVLTLVYYTSDNHRSTPGLSNTSNTLAPSSQSNHWPGWSGIKHIMSFGDSYTATAFDIHKAQPSEANPMGNPPYPGHTSSNGPTWIGFLTTTHNQTFIKTLNFAQGGATVDGDLIRQYLPTIHSFKVQVNDLYIPNYSKPTADFNWCAEDTLFTVFFGINDINNSYKDGDSAWVLDLDVKEYATLLDTLYQSGARNFLIMNVPPFDRSPLIASHGVEAQEDEAKLISAFNANVTRIVTNLSNTHPDARTFIFDTNSIYNQVLKNPCAHEETCAIKDVAGNCDEYGRGMGDWYANDPKCPHAVDEYFWLNPLHPGFRIQNATAKAVAAQLSREV